MSGNVDRGFGGGRHIIGGLGIPEVGREEDGYPRFGRRVS